GVVLDRTYQLNVGGNTDFLNMLDHARTTSKRVSKTDAVQSALPRPLPAEDVHIGPSDYVPWQRDNKICFLRMEGRGFGNAPGPPSSTPACRCRTARPPPAASSTPSAAAASRATGESAARCSAYRPT